VSNEHQNQGVKARNSPLLLSWTTQLLMFRAIEKSQFVALLGINHTEVTERKKW